MAEQQAFPPRGPPERGVGRGHGEFLAAPGANDNLILGGHGDHRPELIDLIGIAVAETRRLNRACLGAWAYRKFRLPVDDEIARFVRQLHGRIPSALPSTCSKFILRQIQSEWERFFAEK